MSTASSSLSQARILAICAARVLLFATFMTVAATIPLLMAEWGLSAVQAGSIITSFTICYAVSLFGFGWIADHLGAKRMVNISAVTTAIASLAFAFFAQDWLSALLLYGLAGLAQGGIYTPLIMVLSDEVAPARRGHAMGLLIASTSVGYATSLGVAGIGIAIGGWQMAFILCGVLPTIGGILLLASLRPVHNRIHPRPHDGGVRQELIDNRQSRLLIGGYVAHSWELVGMWAWIPAFVAAAFTLQGMEGAGATVTGAYFSGVLHLFCATAALTMGGLSDRAGRRPVLIALAAGAMVLSFTLGWLVYAPLLILLPLALLYAVLCLGDSPVLTTALSEAVRPTHLGAVLAWRGLAGFGTGAIAPLAAGLVFDVTVATGAGPAISWGLTFATLGIGGLLALASALALRR